MSLTGSWLSWLALLATVGCFAAVVRFWPLVAGPELPRVLGRVGLLFGINLMVLLTAAIQLNDQFLFFADWADLRGALTGDVATSGMHRGGSANRAEAPVPGPAASAVGVLQPLPAGTPVPDGGIAYQVHGAQSGITAQVVVTLPPGYEASDAATTYPVLETFSGYPGAVTQWIHTLKLPQVLAGVARHRVHQAVIVSPQVQVPTGRDTECVNGSQGRPQLETWLTRDVPDWVVAHFRVRTERTSWAALGLSAGGWCAAMAGMLHPAQYGAAIVLGGYFHPIFGQAYEAFDPADPLRRRYDLVALARRAPPPLAMWVETSHADPLSYSSTAELLAAARAPLSVSATVLQNAGHRMSVWQGMLPNALGWLGTTLSGFHPEPAQR